MNILYLARYLLLAFSLTWISSSGLAQTPPLAAERDQGLRQLSDDYWQFFQRKDPEAATSYGEYQFNDRLRDLSLSHRSLTDKYNAYVEGWALYSERLGKEVGFYRNTASDLGRLESDLFRAIRLVVDTGVHYKRWSRQQMIDYFVAHLNDPMLSEVDRYIADPGQALGYKIGQLKILELRERAQKIFGTKFDIRSFHDAILNGGALPLNLLEQRMDTWMEQNAPRK